MKRTLRPVAAICSALALVGFCSYPNHARIAAHGKQLCARHRVPLVTAHGFIYGGDGVVFVHHKPYKEFEKIDACTPNRIDDLQSLKRDGDITKPALITYCPRCEAEFQKRWYGPNVTMAQLVGTWRHVKTGSTTTIEPNGRCQGIGYDGKPFKGRWKIVRRGLIETQYDGDDFKFHHVITRIESNSFLDRADEGTDKFVRVQ